MGNHEDVRWCALTNNAGNGAVFVATDRLSASALPYSALDLILASHPYQLPKAGDTYLHLDAAVTGLVAIVAAKVARWNKTVSSPAITTQVSSSALRVKT